MNWIQICFLLFRIFVIQSMTQNTRSFQMSIMNGWKFQCLNTTCLPTNTFIESNIRRCQRNCLDDIFCKAVSFSQLIFQCNLFYNIPNPNPNMLVDINTITMIVINGTRISSEIETISTISSPSSSTSSSTTTTVSTSTSSITTTSFTSTSTSTSSTTTTTTTAPCPSGGIPLTFDDIPNPTPSEAIIPSNYSGFTWTNARYANVSAYPTSGYAYARVSGEYVLWFKTTVTIETTPNNKTITLNSGQMSSGWSDGNILLVMGYYTSTHLYNVTIPLNTYSRVLKVFNWSGLNKIILQPSGSGYWDTGIDNLCITF
ncbi:hypothetical protein I4U23_021892 [Adineta vaga]|nr:hypothetical protein I4U23_021892 [Adineta vaga]